ncbi:phosphatidate cytidylyltransferase [Bacillota bacterium LX-D]|nr:phosphatidate cytidylyltransferase [Bacillota bacterium LX-D]
MLYQRILTAVIGVPVAVFIVYLGKLPIFLTVTFISLLGLKEYYHIVDKLSIKPYRILGYLTGIIMLMVIYLNFPLRHYEPLIVLFLIGVINLVVNYGKRSISDLAYTLLGVLYISGLFGYLLLIRYNFINGFWWVIITLVLIWLNDSGAYFSGMYFGKHKLHVHVSPNKTIEGAVGGVLITIIAAIIISVVFGILTIWHSVMLSFLIALAGILGDLWESALKREAGVKDSGNLLPGHGGILDRFDSLLFAAPVVYYYLREFIIN